MYKNIERTVRLEFTMETSFSHSFFKWIFAFQNHIFDTLQFTYLLYFFCLSLSQPQRKKERKKENLKERKKGK